MKDWWEIEPGSRVKLELIGTLEKTSRAGVWIRFEGSETPTYMRYEEIENSKLEEI